MNKLTKADIILGESKRKVKILLDENKLGLRQHLIDVGFRIDVLPQGTKDHDIHKYLNNHNYKLFITQDYDDFMKFNPRNYTIIGIVSREDDLTVSRKIINRIDGKFAEILSDYSNALITIEAGPLKPKKRKIK